MRRTIPIAVMGAGSDNKEGVTDRQEIAGCVWGAWQQCCCRGLAFLRCRLVPLPLHPKGLRQEIVTPSDESDARRRAPHPSGIGGGLFPEAGKVAFALDEVKQALASPDPGFAVPTICAVLIYMQLSDLPMADESFRRALSLRPIDANVLHNHAWLLC